MQHLERTGEAHFLVAERRPQPGWLAAVPLGVIAILPLLSPDPLTVLRLLTAAALLGLVATLLIRGRPRKIRTPLVREGRKLLVGTASYEPVSLTLGGVNENWSTAAPVFQVSLSTSDADMTLIEGTEPASVMAQAEELRRFLDVPLRNGWGIDERASGATPRPAVTSGGAAFRAPLWLSQRATGITSLCSTIFVFGFTTMLLTARVERGLPLLTLSLVLPALTVAYGVLVSGWLLAVRATLELGRDGVVYEQSWLGRVLLQKRLSFAELEQAHAVGPAISPTHVLIKAGAGWVSFRFAGPAATKFVTALVDSGEPTIQPDDSRQASGNTRLSSASAAGS